MYIFSDYRLRDDSTVKGKKEKKKKKRKEEIGSEKKKEKVYNVKRSL